MYNYILFCYIVSVVCAFFLGPVSLQGGGPRGRWPFTFGPTKADSTWKMWDLPWIYHAILLIFLGFTSHI